MDKKDILFAIMCGLAVAWIAIDFFDKYGWVFFIALPILSIIGLLLVELIGKKILFIHQAGKFTLIGAFADVIDIKIFQFLFLLLPFGLFVKGLSFLVATAIKYWLNKYWAFQKNEKNGIKKEVVQFFCVTLVSLALNVGSFYYFTNVLGPQFSMTQATWKELSIILSAIVASICNFLGYKFLVFKK